MDRERRAGLQMQLQEAISSAIEAGQFAAGDRLPSTRGLAAYLGIARITVTMAYQSLVADGYLMTAPRSGYRVSQEAPGVAAAARPEPKPPEGPAVDWAKRLPERYGLVTGLTKPANWRSLRYPFIYGQADPLLFPHDAWRDCARRALGRRDFDVVAGDFRQSDDAMLVSQIIMRSLPGRDLYAEPQQLLVTYGAQNALWLIARLLFDGRPAPAAAIEDPGYPELRELLRLSGVRAVPVPLDEEGLRVDLIPEDVQALFVMPSHHAPTGITMSMRRRQEILALAEARDLVVIEDDYDFEMNVLRRPSPALKSLDRQDRVIYLGSFSKSLFPGLRLGYLLAPSPVVEEARGLRTLVARHPPGITQRTTAYFLALGHYNAHVRRMRDEFRVRCRLMLDSLAEAGIALAKPSAVGGASFWIETPGVHTRQLAERILEAGILIEPGAPFFASERPPESFMRLAFSSIPRERIAEGIAKLAAALKEAS